MTAMDRAARIGLLFQALVIAPMAPGCNFGSQAIQTFVSVAEPMMRYLQRTARQ
jgi:hypothetical protein